jgi:4-amino-4-deoxy-L-arabinose transferase-like glycosyltransferase
MVADHARRKLVLALLVVVAAVILPRVGAGFVASRDYFSRGDLNWDVMAVKLLAGDGLVIPRVGAMHLPMAAHRPPAFPALLAGLYATAGRHAAVLIASQILLSVLATLSVYLLTLRISSDRAAAFLAALISALYPPLVMHDIQISDTTLFRLLVMLMTLLLLSLADRPSLKTAALLGLTAGLAVLTRTAIALFLPLAGLWLVLRFGRETLRRSKPLLVGSVVFLAVLSPWLARNASLFGELHLITGGGRSLWMGWNDSMVSAYPTRTVDIAEQREWEKIPPDTRRKLAALGELEFDREMGDRGREWIRKHHDRLLPLAGKKIRAALSWNFNPVLTGDDLDARFIGMKEMIYTGSYAPLLLLGLAGLLYLLFRHRSAALLLLLQFGAFLAASVLYWAHSRHRYYLDPLFAVAGSILLVAIFRWLGRRREARSEP